MNRRAVGDPESDRRFTLPETLELCRAYTSRRVGSAVDRYDLDPCADEISKTAESNIHAPANGLEVDWHGHVFVNPPWSDIGPWARKAWLECRSPHVKSITMLVPDNRQSVEWWQERVEPFRDRGSVLTTHYMKGRPRYGDPQNPTALTKAELIASGVAPELAKELAVDSPPFGAVVLVWAPSQSNRSAE